MASNAKTSFLKAPPPRVALLPDSAFFVRTVPIAEGTPAADVAAQVELALEALAPFPLAQLYYAHHWVPGARHALVYAAYRKRFTGDQVDGWSENAVVMPAFAALLNADVAPATTLVLSTGEGITAIHFGDASHVPTAVVSRLWPTDATPGVRLELRDEVLRSIGGTKTIVDLTAAPEVGSEGTFGEFIFHAGEITSRFDREQLDNLDVRDKAELTTIRAARQRDLYLWRAFIGCAAAVAIAALLEIGLIGGKFWLRSRQAVMERQAPVVSDIMRSQLLARRIDELSTNRLRPFEMITIIDSKRPKSVIFDMARATNRTTMEIDAHTNMPNDLGVFQNQLRQLNEVLRLDVQQPRTVDGRQTFRIVVEFKPDAFKSTQS